MDVQAKDVKLSISFTDVYDAFDNADKSLERNDSSGHMPVPPGKTEFDVVHDPETGRPWLALEDGHEITYEDIDFYLRDGQPNRIYAKDSDRWEGWVKSLLGGGTWLSSNAGKSTSSAAWNGIGLGPPEANVLVNPSYQDGAEQTIKHIGGTIWGSIFSTDVVSAIIGGVMGGISEQMSATAELAGRAKAAHDLWLGRKRAARLAVMERRNRAEEQVTAQRGEAGRELTDLTLATVDFTGLDAFAQERVTRETSRIRRERAVIALALPAAAVLIVLLWRR